MPLGERAPRSVYRPNPHSLRSTNAFGHKPKKHSLLILLFLTIYKDGEDREKLFFMFIAFGSNYILWM